LSRKKEAALTGVLYYLLEEEQGILKANTANTPRPGIPGWSLSGRNQSALLQRINKSRDFSPPAGWHIRAGGMQERGPDFWRAQKTAENRIRLAGYAAGIRNTSSRNKWNSGS